MRSAVLLVVLVCACLAVADRFQPHEYENSFSGWMTQHGKTYPSQDFQKRFSAYKNNMDFVDEFNQRNESYTVGLNAFADLTVDEFTTLHLSNIPQNHRDFTAENFTGEGVRIPRSNVDWRTSGAVTAIKNQGQCGSCWTFSTAAAIESAYKIAKGTPVTLSEQQLLDCTPSQNGCNGGSFISAFQYVISNGGLDTETSYPYTGAQGTCHYSAASSGASITSWQAVTPNSEPALQAAVTNQPVSVGIRADTQSFQLYKSGTYSDTGCTATPINHAVVAIGYGTDSTGDYWLLKNSWGTSWGIQGFAQIKRGVNLCGISSGPAFPSLQSTSGLVWQDYLFPGWGFMYSGSMSGLSVQAPGNPGYAIQASVGAKSKLMLSTSTAASTAGHTQFCFDISTSAAGSVTFSIGSTSLTTATTTAYKTVCTALSSLGSPASVTSLSWTNAGTATNTLNLDNVKFA